MAPNASMGYNEDGSLHAVCINKTLMRRPGYTFHANRLGLRFFDGTLCLTGSDASHAPALCQALLGSFTAVDI